MGFSYGLSYATGRYRLACDFCDAADGTTRKMRCPYGYCQAWATCKSCRQEKKHREISSVGVVDENGNDTIQPRKAHEHCKNAMDQKAQDIEMMKVGGLNVIIASGNWHAAESVHGLYYIINPKLPWYEIFYTSWHEKNDLLAKLGALGHTVQEVSDEEAQEIVKNQRSGFFARTSDDESARPIEEVFASL